MSFDIISRLILKMKHSEQRPGVLVFLLAEKITRLDSFFSVFSSNLNIVAFVTESKFHTGILAPVLSAVVAAMIWSGTDIVFNFSQQKNQERKKSNSVYNPISNV